jgi:hypothetical protein
VNILIISSKIFAILSSKKIIYLRNLLKITKKAKKSSTMKTKVLGPAKKPFAAGIPFFTGAGQTGPGYMKKGGAVKATKFSFLFDPPILLGKI